MISCRPFVANCEEAPLSRLIIGAATEVVTLARPDKLGTAAPFLIAPISELTQLVTTSREDQLAPYRAAGAA